MFCPGGSGVWDTTRATATLRVQISPGISVARHLCPLSYHFLSSLYCLFQIKADTTPKRVWKCALTQTLTRSQARFNKSAGHKLRLGSFPVTQILTCLTYVWVSQQTVGLSVLSANCKCWSLVKGAVAVFMICSRAANHCPVQFITEVLGRVQVGGSVQVGLVLQ